MLTPWLPVTNPCDILKQNRYSKEKIGQKDEVQQINEKVVMLEMKFKSNINGVIGEIVDWGNVDIIAMWKTLDI